MFYMSAGAYALVPVCALANSRPFLLTAALIAIWIALGTNLGGEDREVDAESGAICTWLLGALLVTIAGVLYMRRARRRR